MLRLKRTHSDDPHFQELIIALDKDLWIRYPEVQQDYEVLDKVKNIPTVVVAYVDALPVGCACFRQFDTNTIEIKRMFVHNTHRGQGIAYAILKELETWAISEGFSRAVLETGIRQPEAIALYQKSGYTFMDKYPPYEQMENSVCLQKPLL
ncbi:MAG: family N-acetyltransferase [Bacteroidetes bacterium]|uniref:GNAT family N-acetyltransferase n=1 Tax=unclassified Chitinophaga TaxID=2619133 RepID=UPI0009CC723F|nr:MULTISPECIES: GNAT family N-acetyltransferase [unclassified Chitinophaga]MBP1652137.1 family N-acetyltransferase [Bacteroidota bacterium]OMP76457.1 GNAT family N-acetyltransferase [[Flexibacter] sp. ATCC 35208]WPV66213.1 GNAT family N-acetyltransferase [Chitinophaga sp. LS1]